MTGRQESTIPAPGVPQEAWEDSHATTCPTEPDSIF